MYNEDETFAKMIQMAKNSILQVFKGTNPRQKLIADEPERLIMITKTLE